MSVCEEQAEAAAVRERRVQEPVMDELVTYVWRRMPIRSAMLGRQAVSAAVESAVREWPVEALCGATGDAEDYSEQLAPVRAAIANDKRCGSVLLLFAISTIISLVFQWWLHNRHSKQKVAQWKLEMKA